jgi:hypothetical protein
MSISAQVKTTYTVSADNPAVGAPIIRAMLSSKGAELEVERLRKAGCENIKVTPTRDPAGSAG